MKFTAVERGLEYKGDIYAMANFAMPKQESEFFVGELARRWNAFEEGGPLADISNPAALPRVLDAVKNLMPYLLHANGTPLIDGLDAEIIALDEAMNKLGAQP
jgi:hypothetical protein